CEGGLALPWVPRPAVREGGQVAARVPIEADGVRTAVETQFTRGQAVLAVIGGHHGAAPGVHDADLIVCSVVAVHEADAVGLPLLRDAVEVVVDKSDHSSVVTGGQPVAEDVVAKQNLILQRAAVAVAPIFT